ncbi:MAG: methyltransferase domain-containing protein [Rhodospirillales bacterium]|jgi:2-polyprenyl-3-methyl-5-hydroxy-6-metoxy-1,4-benzoquinol methylase|nr:methyltransferase domain-containing protein [Rhodospirillales bacterium]
MKNWALKLLSCPYCVGDDPLILFPTETSGEDVTEGVLSCPSCNREYQISNAIPRFVETDENYAENFGDQWQEFRTTQIDRLGGHDLSGSRMLKDTRWSPEWISGKLILDAGCGAGRFADELAQHGARVIACDLSSATDACKQTVDDPTGYSANRGEVAVIQANLLAMPFRHGVFDAVHCAGVIQHTPDPAQVIRTLPVHLKSSGRLFYNFYEIDPTTKYQAVKYLLRRWTPSWRMRNLLVFCLWMCRILFIPSWIMSRIPVVRFFNRFLPICSVHPPKLSLRQQYDLTLLDTVDWYGPRYEIRQDHKQVAALLSEEGLDQVESAAGLAWAVKR